MFRILQKTGNQNNHTMLAVYNAVHKKKEEGRNGENYPSFESTSRLGWGG